jgi:hypothetical protein
MDGAGLVVVLDLNAKHLVELSEVNDLDVLAQALNEVINELGSAGGYCAVIYMYRDGCELVLVFDGFVEHSLVNSTLFETE